MSSQEIPNFSAETCPACRVSLVPFNLLPPDPGIIMGEVGCPACKDTLVFLRNEAGVIFMKRPQETKIPFAEGVDEIPPAVAYLELRQNVLVFGVN